MRAAGSHPLLVEVLEPHDTKMKAIVGQAETMRQLQVNNINALFECEKKQAEDENKARAQAAQAARPPRASFFFTLSPFSSLGAHIFPISGPTQNA